MTLLNNTPGIKTNWIDGNLLPEQSVSAPRVVIVGTAAQGTSDPYFVNTSAEAKSEFGNDGTLIRGMYEATKASNGLENMEVVLLRIGATEAKLEHVGDSGGSAGYTITTKEKDASSGANYSIWYDDSTDRIVIKRNADGIVVYDNSSSAPIDYFEVYVSGVRATSGGPSIGSASSFVNLEDVDPSTYTGTSYTAGTDGLDLSRMEMYNELYKAYKTLLAVQFDAIVPMDVYLDDYNVIDQGSYDGAVAPVSPSSNTYPTAGAYSLGSDIDSLGRVYVEKYEGEYYFWWWYGASGASFTAAEIYPSVGSASATTKTDGTALSASDFHEVNFAYQLGRFLYDYGVDIIDATGTIGVKPPKSGSIVDMARFLGEKPTWTRNSFTGEYYIANASDNGKGLYGNKFMVGKNDHRSGVFGGGFILTDSEFMDGTEVNDSNGVPIDLGKYISVLADTMFLTNTWFPGGYRATFAASYAGMYLPLDANIAPTNQIIPSGAQRVYRFNPIEIDALVGYGYVTISSKEKGLVITSAPTASMPNSDYRRLSTVRIVKEITDGIRASGDKYIGAGMTGAKRAALQNDTDKVLSGAQKVQYIQAYKPPIVIQTKDQEVAGVAIINISIIPAFELQFLTLNVSLAKPGSF